MNVFLNVKEMAGNINVETMQIVYTVAVECIRRKKMPKVKIFDSNSKYCLEEKINKFIQDKKVFDISYNVHICGYSAYHSACVLYEDYGRSL